jgi:hypothetical protein
VKRTAFYKLIWLSFFALSVGVLGAAGNRSDGASRSYDESHPYDSPTPLPQPRIFGDGIISTGDYDLSGCFAPDGRTLYFAKTVPVNRLGLIVFSTWSKGKWSAPEVAPFSGMYTDYDPFIVKDGSKLYFISNRPLSGSRRDYNILVVDKTATGWSEPRDIGPPINTPNDEFFPSVTDDGTMYFSALREGGKGSFDIYRSRLVNGKYTEPENLGDAINSRAGEIDAAVAADQSFMVFACAGRPDSLGDSDLYISFNRGGVWTPARNLGPPINSKGREFCPGISPNGKYLFFTSSRGFWDEPLKARISSADLRKRLANSYNGMGDIYQVDVSALGTP